MPLTLPPYYASLYVQFARTLRTDVVGKSDKLGRVSVKFFGEGSNKWLVAENSFGCITVMPNGHTPGQTEMYSSLDDFATVYGVK